MPTIFDSILPRNQRPSRKFDQTRGKKMCQAARLIVTTLSDMLQPATPGTLTMPYRYGALLQRVKERRSQVVLEAKNSRKEPPYEFNEHSLVTWFSALIKERKGGDSVKNFQEILILSPDKDHVIINVIALADLWFDNFSDDTPPVKMMRALSVLSIDLAEFQVQPQLHLDDIKNCSVTPNEEEDQWLQALNNSSFRQAVAEYMSEKPEGNKIFQRCAVRALTIATEIGLRQE